LKTSAGQEIRATNGRRGKDILEPGSHPEERDMTKRLNSFAVLLLSLPSIALAQRDDEGQTLAEYALILALIAVIVVGIVAVLGGNISGIFSRITSQI